MKRVMPLVLILSLVILAWLGWSDVWVLFKGRPWGDAASNAVGTLQRSGDQAAVVENGLPEPALDVASATKGEDENAGAGAAPTRKSSAAEAIEEHDKTLGEMNRLAEFLAVPYVGAVPDFDPAKDQSLIDIAENRKLAASLEQKLRDWERDPKFDEAKKRTVRTDLERYRTLAGRDNALAARISLALEGKAPDVHLHGERGAAILAIGSASLEEQRTGSLGRRLSDLKGKIQGNLIDNDILLVTKSGLMRFEVKNNASFANQEIADSFAKAFEAAYEIKRQREAEGHDRPLRVAILWISPVGLDNAESQNVDVPEDLKSIVTLFWIKPNASETPADQRFASAFPDHFQAFASSVEDLNAFGDTIGNFIKSGSETP